MWLKFVWIGETKDPYLLPLEERYLKRLEHFFPCSRSFVPEIKRVRHQEKRAFRRETLLLEDKISPNTYLIALDETGREYSSPDFARLLEGLLNQGRAGITFVTGGFSGLPDQIKNGANLKWSLSSLTLPHELARVVLLEQVYRAVTIVSRVPYHK